VIFLFRLKVFGSFVMNLIEANDLSRDVARMNAERRGRGKWKKMENTWLVVRWFVKSCGIESCDFAYLMDRIANPPKLKVLLRSLFCQNTNLFYFSHFFRILSFFFVFSNFAHILLWLCVGTWMVPKNHYQCNSPNIWPIIIPFVYKKC